MSEVGWLSLPRTLNLGIVSFRSCVCASEARVNEPMWRIEVIISSWHPFRSSVPCASNLYLYPLLCDAAPEVHNSGGEHVPNAFEI